MVKSRRGLGFFFFQAEDGIRDVAVTGVQTCALPISVVGVSCKRAPSAAKPADVDYYTCTMHPSVKSQDPKGKCPICGMNLVPVKKRQSRIGEPAMGPEGQIGRASCRERG